MSMARMPTSLASAAIAIAIAAGTEAEKLEPCKRRQQVMIDD